MLLKKLRKAYDKSFLKSTIDFVVESFFESSLSVLFRKKRNVKFLSHSKIVVKTHSLAATILTSLGKILDIILPKNLEGKRFVQVILVAVLIRLILLIVNHFNPLFMNAGNYDVSSFHMMGLEILHEGFPSRLHLTNSGVTASYGYFLAAIYYLFESNMSIGIFVNVILGLLMCFNTYRITKLLFGKKSAKTALVISLFIPSYILLSVSLIRDVLIAFCITEILYLAVKHFNSEEWKHVLWMALFFATVYYLRPDLIPIILIPLILILFYHHFDFRRELVIGGALLAVAFTLTPQFSQTLNVLDRTHQTRARGRTAYLENARFNTIESYASNIPLGATYALYSPMAHQITKPSLELVPFAEGTFFLLLTLIILFYFGNLLTYSKNKSSLWLLVLYIMLYAAVLGVVDTNIGTAYRHRIQATFIFIIMASPLITKTLENLKKISKLPQKT